MAKFTHLHLHTEYSLLDGLSKITPLLDHIKANNMDSVAITDHGTMYGAIEFYKKANAAGIKPIIGCEAYITNVDHKLRGDRDNTKNYHLLLLAKNEEGYKAGVVVLKKMMGDSQVAVYEMKDRVVPGDGEVEKKLRTDLGI